MAADSSDKGPENGEQRGERTEVLTQSDPVSGQSSRGSRHVASGSGPTRAPQRSFQPGTVLGGRYRIVDRVGRGAMGEVYRAQDLKLSQQIALKFISGELARRRAAISRFLAEVRLAREISHPNICRVHDLGEIEGRHFLTMEFIDGENAESLLRRIGRLPREKAIQLGRQICAGLKAAHDRGILHRDLKPANLMIDGQGQAKITDFGLAGLAGDLSERVRWLGTPAYAAPEQFSGQPNTIRTDLYALGLVLFKLLTGREAFAATSVDELARLHAEQQPDPLSMHLQNVDPALEQVILSCMAKSPQARPSSAAEVGETLRLSASHAELAAWRPQANQEVPGRPHWQLERKLGEGGFGEAWLARHSKTGESRVFKFCTSTERLRGLQRETTVFRLLRESLGQRPDINRILDWSFTEPPYYLESEYLEGGSLLDYAQARGGPSSLSLTTRLELVAQVATALAAAHSVGVLHKDVKPGNILVEERDGGSLRAQLSDFGLGRVTEVERLQQAGITVLGLTEMESESIGAGLTAGTRLYQAPEALEGRPATVQGDIYALGVVLYQMVVADFSRALAPGWERDIDDPLLVKDIAAAVDGSPQRRLGDAQQLAERLRTLDRRRSEQERTQHEQEERERSLHEAERAQRSLRRTRRRLAIAVVAMLLLTLFGMAMAWQFRAAANEAESKERTLSWLVNAFDLPEGHAMVADQIPARRVLDRAAQSAHEDLKEQFPEDYAALLHQVGLAYQKLGSFTEARELLEIAVQTRRSVLGSGHDDTTESQLALASLLKDAGESRRAVELAREALERRQSSFSGSSVEVLEAKWVLAGALFYVDPKDPEVLSLYQEVLAGFNAQYRRPHVKIARAQRDLGVVQSRNRALAEAERNQVAALEDLSQLFGESHIELATSYKILAMLRSRQDLLDEAEALFVKSIDIYGELVGLEHPHAISSLAELGIFWFRRGEYAKARPSLQDALDRHRRSSYEDFYTQAVILEKLAQIEDATGSPDKAIPLFQEAMQAYRQSPSFDEVENAKMGLKLARSFEKAERFAAAIPVLEDALAVLGQHGEDEAGTVEEVEELRTRLLEKLG